MLEALSVVQTPDETLVRQARAGDRSACEELFQRHRSDSYRCAYRLLGHEHDALDVVQEAMSKAFSAPVILTAVADFGPGCFESLPTPHTTRVEGVIAGQRDMGEMS